MAHSILKPSLLGRDELQPVAASTVYVMERSILTNAGKDNMVPFTVGNRKRYATCSGVAWLSNELLAVVNYYGKHLRIYRFKPGAPAGSSALTLLHEMKLGYNAYPENVAASPDGLMLAITYYTMSLGKHGVSLHRLDQSDHSPSPAKEVLHTGACHGVCFAPDSRHFVFTDISRTGYIEVVNVATGKPTCRLTNKSNSLKQKGIAISKDGRYAAIISAREVRPSLQQGRFPCVIAVYRYIEQDGLIDEMPVAEYEYEMHEFNSLEACAFFPSQTECIYRLLTVDQANDLILVFEFDGLKKQIDYGGVLSEDTSFPHSIDVSPDGQFVATTNYGDDTLRILKWPGYWERSIHSNVKLRTENRARLFGSRAVDSNFGLRIALVSDHTFLPDRVGGRESSMHDLALAFVGEGHSVCLIVRKADSGKGASWLSHLLWRNPYRVDRVNDIHIHTESLMQEGQLDIAIYNCNNVREYVWVDRSLSARQVFYVRDTEEVYSWLPDTFPEGTRFLANSKFISKAIEKHTGIVPDVITPLINTKRYFTGTKRRFVTFINPVKVKGVELAFEIAKLCPEIHFQFVESWPLNENKFAILKDEVSRYPNISLCRTMLDIRAIYKQTSILLVPSMCEEGFGRVVIEAQISGIPVLASNIGGLPEAVADGGILLEPDAEPKLWAAALRSIWHNENRWYQLSNNARQNAEEYTERSIDTVERILGQKGRLAV